MNLRSKVVFLLFVAVICSCSNPEHDPPTSPEAQVAALLNEHRVVMLGDSGHGRAQPFFSVLRVLDAWLDNLQNGNPAPRNLTLVLEADTELSGLVSNYSMTGEWDPLLNYLLPYSSLETLEFYAGLRRTQQRVADMQSVSLVIIGKEPGTIRDDVEWNIQEAYRFFIDRRDSLTAAGILEHMRDYPDNGVLIFYGNAHLANGWADKSQWAPSGVDTTEGFGFWLPHYLEREVGLDEVVTIDQIVMPPQWRKRSVVPADTLMSWAGIPPTHQIKQNLERRVDMAIMRASLNVVGHPVRNTACRPIIEAQLKELRRVNPLREHSFHANRDAVRFRDALSLFSDVRFETLSQWQNWWSPDDFDGQTAIRAEAFSKHVIELMQATSRRDNASARRLLEIGLSRQTVMSIYSEQSTDFEQVWQQVSDQIMALQSIGMWWCGDMAEQSAARLFLGDLSGREFHAPDEALRWWRQVYQGADY